jgi:hypothetical protein
MGRSSTLRLMAAGLLVLGGGIAHGAEPALHALASGTATARASDGSPIAAATFYAGETVQFYCTVGWDGTADGASHELRYQWYDERGASVGGIGGQKVFTDNPETLWSFAHAGHFPAGHYRVELAVDGQPMGSAEFDVLTGLRFSEPPEDALVREGARTLLREHRLREFADAVAALRISRERTASGNWKLGLWYAAISRRLYPAQDPRWDALQESADAFVGNNPDLPAAVLLDAQLLYAHAWAWRGEDFAANVAPQNYQHYQELLARAAALLDQHPQVAREDPQWDALRVSVAREQGASSDQILALAGRALEREGYYYPLHSAVANALLPRWGGSREALLEYVRMALGHSRLEGTQAYARIWYYVARASAAAPIDDLNALGGKWPPMQQGLAELLKAYPSTFNRDLSRDFNCIVGDAPGYRAFGSADAVKFVPVGRWDTAEHRQFCNGWAFEGRHGHASLPQRVHAYWSFLSGFGDPFWARLRIAAFVALLLTEVSLALLGRLWASRPQPWQGLSANSRLFNPAEYPRTYLVTAARDPYVLRLAVWMVVLGVMIPYMLWTIPWPDPQETQLVFAGCIAVGIGGVMLVLSRLAMRVVLTAQGITLGGLLRRVTVQRSDIVAVGATAVPGDPRRVFDVFPRQTPHQPVRVPSIWGEDEAFRAWFASLPPAGPECGSAVLARPSSSGPPAAHPAPG